MTDQDEDLVERRAVRAQEKLVKQQEGQQAMDEHLAALERQKEKTLRLRELRHALEAENADRRQGKACNQTRWSAVNGFGRRGRILSAAQNTRHIRW